MEQIKKSKLSITLLTVIISTIAAIMIYFILGSGAKIDFKLNWNMFNSVAVYPLAIIGFFVGLGQKFDVYKPIIRTKYSDGRPDKIRDDHDITRNMETGCLMPLLNYLVIFPLAFAALIYYSILILISIFGTFFSLILTIFYIFSVFIFHKCQQRAASKPRKKRIIINFLLTTGFILIFWLIYYFWTIDAIEINAYYVNLSTIILTIIAWSVIGWAEFFKNDEIKEYTGIVDVIISRKLWISIGIYFVLISTILCFKCCNV